VRDLTTGAIIGSTRYHDIVPGIDRVEIGHTWYAQSRQRTHVNTACKLLLFQHAFETVGCAVVGLRTDNFNFASQRAIEALGAKKDGVLRHHGARKDGSARDTVMYSILAAEWPDVRRHLELRVRKDGVAVRDLDTTNGTRHAGVKVGQIVLTGTAQGQARRFEFDVTFDAQSEGLSKFFVERLWAQRKIGDIIDQIQLYGRSQELVDEIIRVSIKYGLITEYPSFLIREDVRLGDASGNHRRVAEQLERLKEADGVAGNRQVMGKKDYQNADKAAAPASGGGGVRYKDENGREIETKSIANIGRRTFFQKNKVWQEADVPDDVQAKEVKFFSDEFFKLLEEHPDLNQIATLDADLILKVKDGYVKAVK